MISIFQNTSAFSNSGNLPDNNQLMEDSPEMRYIHIKDTRLTKEFHDLQLDLDLPVDNYDQALKIANLSISGFLSLPDAILIDVPFTILFFKTSFNSFIF